VTQQLLQAAAEAAATTKPVSMLIEDNKVDQASRQVLGSDAKNAEYDLTAKRNTSQNQSYQMIGTFSPESIRTVLGSASASTIQGQADATGTARDFAMRFMAMASGPANLNQPVQGLAIEDRFGVVTLADTVASGDVEEPVQAEAVDSPRVR